jgi:hypothetical protein
MRIPTPAVLLVLVAATAAPLLAGAPRGPAFGNVRYRTEITAGSTPDVDVYATDLLPGEVLSVSVAADRGSGLVPALSLVGPDGVERTPALAAGRTGRSLSFRKFVVDRAGRWAVQVAGANASTGAYTARFTVKPAPGANVRKQRLGGGEPVERVHEFAGVDGAAVSLTLRLARGSAQASVSAVADPAGGVVPFDPPRTRGATSRYPLIPLAGGAGTYTVSVGLDEGEAAYDLALAVSAPARPKGTIALSPLEPKLAAVASPLRGNGSQVVRLTGANFSVNPRPEVWFGDARASVLQVALGGAAIDVQPPKLPDGTLVDVTVVNPDGQANCRTSYFEYSVPEPPALARLSPGTASVYASATLRYSVALTRPAPSGANVQVSTVGAVGAVPPAVTIAAGSSSATFELVAAAAPATGRVLVTYADVTLSADVSVVADPGGGGEPPPLPDEVDVSGWKVVQANSARTFTIPQGTKLRQGDWIVIGRAATKQAFETYWGVTLGADVVYLTNDPGNSTSSTDDWPSINGGETYELRDSAGATVDGPSAAMAAAGGENWQRKAGQPAGTATSWTVSTVIAPGGPATPGSGPADTAKHGVYVSEFADASGPGAFVYEFVELHFDGLAP